MKFGFPTGKLDGISLKQAIERNAAFGVTALEITALRVHEMDTILGAAQQIVMPPDVEVSYHAPSSMSFDEERRLFQWMNDPESPLRFAPIVIHPDAMLNYGMWALMGKRVRIENMDLRKKCGIYPDSLRRFFELCPRAKWCFDIGHARQVDPSMMMAKDLLAEFGGRLAEIHMSVVEPSGKHVSMTESAQNDYQLVFEDNNFNVPVIAEVPLNPDTMAFDLKLIRGVFEKD